MNKREATRIGKKLHKMGREVGFLRTSYTPNKWGWAVQIKGSHTFYTVEGFDEWVIDQAKHAATADRETNIVYFE